MPFTEEPLPPAPPPPTRQAFRQTVRHALTPLQLDPLQWQAEVRLILAFVLVGISESDWLKSPETPLTPAQVTRARALLHQRVMHRIPVQYLTGQADFYGLRLTVTPDVLIPRPETERLIEAACTLATQHPVRRVLELGTGSGALACALASVLPHPAHHVWATDVCPRALAVAAKNVRSLGFQHTVTLLHGSWFEPVPAALTFDCIVSNPPYIDPVLRNTLLPEVLQEPEQALFAADCGLAGYRDIAAQYRPYLNPGGQLLLEFGDGMATSVSALFEGPGVKVSTLPDLSGAERVLKVEPLQL